MRTEADKVTRSETVAGQRIAGTGTVENKSFSVRIDPLPELNPEPEPNVCESLASAREVALPAMSTCVLILTILAICYTLYFCKPVMLPITGAFLLNLFFSPVVAFLKKRGLPYVAGTFLVMGTFLMIVAAAFWFSAGPAQSWLQDKDKNLAVVESKLLALKKPVEEFVAVSKQIDEITQKSIASDKAEPEPEPEPEPESSMEKFIDSVNVFDGDKKGGDKDDEKEKQKAESKVVPVEVTQPSISRRIFSTTGDTLVGISLMLILLFYLLASGDRGLEKLVELMPTFRNKRRVVELTHAIEKSISSYLLTTTAINAVLGLTIGTGMWLIGMPNPILWGLMAMLLNYLPFVGAIIGAAIVFLAGIISFDSLPYATLAPAIYLFVNIIEANFITPILLGRSVSLHPVWLMIFFVVVSWVWGVGGAIVAVPLLAVIKISCDHIEPLMPIGTFLGR